MKPHIVKDYLTVRRGSEKASASGGATDYSEETSRLEREMLEAVVSKGSGRNAKIEGYSVGGKNGYSAKAGTWWGYSTTDYVASFIGFAPVDDPRLVAIVVVDTPKGVSLLSVDRGSSCLQRGYAGQPPAI